MQFTSVFALFIATASVVLATPTGHTFIRAECDIAGCVTALGGGVVSCAAAAAQGGANLFADAGCLVAAANTVTNFPPDCNQCIEEFGIVTKAQDALESAGDAVGDAASGAVEDVKGAVDSIGDKVGGFFGSIFG